MSALKKVNIKVGAKLHISCYKYPTSRPSLHEQSIQNRDKGSESSLVRLIVCKSVHSPPRVRVQLPDEVVHVAIQLPAGGDHDDPGVEQLGVPHHGTERLAFEELVDVLEH